MSDERAGMQRGRSEGEAPRVHVGAFGKHPAWNDHIDDQGLSTTELTETKRLLYVEGMSGNIDAGTWEALGPTDRIDELQHQFLWRTRNGIVIGRFWSSRDGKGRAKYPLVVCAHVMGADAGWVCRHAAPVLEGLETTCKAATTQDEFIHAIEVARGDLRREAASATTTVSPERTTTRMLADDAAMGPQRQGMHRLLYQFDRDMAAFRPASASTAMRMAGSSPRPQLARVPRVEATVEKALLSWLRFCEEQLSDGASVWLIAPEHHDWVDMIVGEPTQKLLACVKTGPGVVPLTTEVPYALDDEFVMRAEANIARSMAEIAANRPTKGLREAAEAARSAISGAMGKHGGAKRELPVKMIAGAAAGVLVLGLAAVLLPKACSSSGPSTPKVKATTKGEPAPDPSTISDSAKRTWEQWCDDHEWIRVIARRAQTANLGASDEVLAALIAGAADPELDPRTLANRAGASVGALRSDPPAVLATGSGQARAESAAARVAALRSSLEAGEWRVRGDYERVLAATKTYGWAPVERYLARVASGLNASRATDVAQGIEELVRVSGPLSQASGSLESIESAREVMDESGVPMLAGLDEFLRSKQVPAGVEGADALRSLAGELAEAATTAQRVVTVLEKQWPGVDHAYFASNARLEWQPGSPVDRAALEDWVAQATRPEFRKLDPAEDPRTGFGSELAQLRQLVDDVQKAGVDSSRQEVQSIVASLNELTKRIETIKSRAWVAAERDGIDADLQQARRDAARLRSGLQNQLAMAAATRSEFITKNDARRSITGEQSEAIDAAWRARWGELKSMYPADTDYGQLSARTQQLEQRLTAIADEFETQVPAARVPGDMQAMLTARREKAIRASLAATPWREGRLDTEAAESVAARRKEAEALSTWAGQAVALSQRVMAVQKALAEGRGANDQMEGGSVEEVIASIESAPIFAEVRPAMQGAWTGIEHVKQIWNRSDAPALCETGLESSERPIVFATWRRLGEIAAWPSGLEQLRKDDELQEHVTSLARQIDDAERRRVLGEEIASAQRARWAKAIEREGEAEAFASMLEMGPPAWREGLSARVRFNAEAMAAQARLGQLSGLTDVEMQAAIREMLQKLTAGDTASGAVSQGAKDWLAELRRLAEVNVEDVPPVDLAEFGPGAAGWEVAEFDDGRRVVYTRPGGGTQLEFLLTENASESGAPVYLATQELSVEVANAIVTSLDAWEALAKEWGPLHESMTGGARSLGTVFTWQWSLSSTNLDPADQWLRAERTFRPAAPGQTYYEQSLRVARPTAKAPLNALNGPGAAAIARSIGCRLPTSREWLAGLEQWGAPQGEGSNLRDETWRKQLEYAKSRNAAEFPDDSAFVPSEIRGQVPLARSAAAATTEDDGWLWFAPVDQGAGRMMHAIGNVWELVDDGTEAEPDYGVIGGSALSAAELGTKLHLIRRDRRVASDFGVRLCFDLGGLQSRRVIPAGVRRLVRESVFQAP